MTDVAKIEAGAGSIEDRFSEYERWRAQGAVAPLRLGRDVNYVLPRYRDIAKLCNSAVATVQPSIGSYPRHIGRGPASIFYKESLPHMDRPVHSRMRGIVMKALNPKTVGKMTEWVSQIIDSIVARLVTASEVEVVSFLANQIPAAVGCRMLHLPASALETLFAKVEHLNTIVGHEPVTQLQLKQADAAAEFYADFFSRHVAELPELPDDDLVGCLIAAMRSGALTESELNTTLMGLFLASYHTTRTSIANLFYAFGTNSDEWRKLAANPLLAEQAWDESLRFLAPVHYVHRYVSEPLQIGDQQLAPGQRILLCLASGNRDSDQFSNADRFLIDRPDCRHLSFALGSHFCLGASLSRLEGRILLDRMARRFQRLELACEPVWSMNLTFPFIDSLRVRFVQ